MKADCRIREQIDKNNSKKKLAKTQVQKNKKILKDRA